MKTYVRFRNQIPPMTNSYRNDWTATVRYQVESFIRSRFKVRTLKNLSIKPKIGYDNERLCEYAEFTWVVDNTLDKDSEKIIWLT